MGLAASAAAVLLAGGAKERYALPFSRIMIHQPWIGSIGGQATDIDIHAKQILKTRETLNQILADYCGQTLEKIQGDTERDDDTSAAEAVEYGIIDQVITR